MKSTAQLDREISKVSAKIEKLSDSLERLDSQLPGPIWGLQDGISKLSNKLTVLCKRRNSMG